MANLSPNEQFDDLKKKIEETVADYFPLETKRSRVVLKGVEVKDNLDSEDLRSQKKAIKEGRTWAVPVYADLALERDGEEINRRKVLLMRLPKTTQRFGYIVEGNEYQTLNQFRLKPGVYHHVAGNGDIRAEFNMANKDQLAGGYPFAINFKPDEGIFYIKHKHSEIPAYHLLKSAGIDDDTLERAWGRELLQKNKERLSSDQAYSRFHRAVHGKIPGEPSKFKDLFGSLLGNTEISKETTKSTLGKSFDNINSDVLVRSTQNLLGISRGTRQPDDKSSLEYQSVHSFEDLLDGQLRKASSRIRRRALSKVDKKKSVRDLFTRDDFDRHIRSFFRTSLVSQPDQTNPLEMVSGRRKTTIMGEQGGIKSSYAISEDAKLINPSHLGFLDPIHTPEGDKTGVSLSLPLGVRKEGNKLTSLFQRAKDGKTVRLDPGEALSSTVAFPDQYDRKEGKLHPRGKLIRATRNGEIVTVKPNEVDYVLPSPRAIFGVSSNLVPFLQNNQGNRAMTAARQQEQAVPLLNREAPLVQVKTDRKETFEELLGRYASRHSPVDGTVEAVKSDAVVVRDSKGKKHEVQFYRDFPLKGHTIYDSEVKVKAGDTVKAGQLLADSTFTKDGKLALGTNLKTAYMPFHGYNFEDGIVISDAAAKKLTSLHMYEKGVTKGAETVLNRAQFMAHHPYAYIREQVDKIGKDGVIEVGSVVHEGDPLILSLRKPRETEYQKQLKTFRRGRPTKLRDTSVRWDKAAPGVVTDVTRKGKDVIIHVKTQEAAQIGDKVVGRHGNKGVITQIIPESQMPYRTGKDGEKEHMDILLNPLGVPGRINLGQILETVAGKIADERGSAYEVRNFEPGKDYLEELKKEVKAAGLSDKEKLIDPNTGKPYDQKVLTGNQYILKLKHQVAKKMSARSGSGPGSHYDVNHAPSSGAPHGGQKLGELGLYSMLAHGARENIHEMFAYKSNHNQELWDAIREGTPIPPPKVPFAYDKFLGYLNGMRVNVRKDGNHLTLVPFIEDQILQMSSGELKEPGLVFRGKDNRPEPGGLFDEKVTGGPGGTRWAHFRLAEPMPNPLFESAIKKLTGITKAEFNAYMKGEEKVNGKTGGAAIQELLKQVDVKKEKAEVEAKLKKAKKSSRASLHAKLRILKALDENNLDPTVYMMRNVPVLPPVFRPVVVQEDGSLSADDLNGLYKDLGAVNETLRDNKIMGIPEKHIAPLRTEMYDGLKALTGTGAALTREYRGIIDTISGKIRKQSGQTGGSGGKYGFFQKQLLKRRQDFTGRSIIIPEPRMDLDELGLPEDIAWTMYQPFIERELTKQGYNMLDAIDEVKKRSTSAENTLLRVMDNHPVFLKRDPALHKYNVMAFKPRLVRGKAIEIHPLVTSGYNADFDGDTMAVYLPVTPKAIKEARGLFPSNNLFSATTGSVMYTPGHEALLGLYLMSKPGKRTDKKFANAKEAAAAEKAGKIKATDVITVGGAETTVGRLRIESVLPEWLRETGKKKPHEMRVFDKGTLKDVLTSVAKKSPDLSGEVSGGLLRLGNSHSTNVGFSIGLDDFTVINKEKRDKLIEQGEARAAKIRASGMTKSKQDQKIVEIYQAINDEIDKANWLSFDLNPTNISKMVDSGSRGDRQQLKQIVSTPALVMDAKNRVVPHIIPRSYAEGMDLASYWTSLHGARKGLIQKVQGVRDPGYLSKQIMNSSMNQLVTEDDCGTRQGIWLNVDDPDVMDRRLAVGMKLGDKAIGRGALVTPGLVALARKNKKSSVFVRSPMRCEAEHGICKRCMGLAAGGKSYDIGDNVGVMAGQAIGEPSTQLSLNVFHTGGLAKGKGAKSKGTFDRLQSLLRMPTQLVDSAPLALTNGKVTKVEKAPQGGEFVYVNNVQHYIPSSQERMVKLRDEVPKGMPLSDGIVDPRRLLPLRGVRAVQDYIAAELQRVLGTAVPVRRRNVEVVVKAMTNVTRIEDPGEHPEWVTGDMRPTSKVHAWNKKAKNPVTHTPVLKGVDILPLEMQEDWMARLNFQRLGSTLTQAAREGWSTNIHGFHPVPAAAFATEFGKGEEILGKDWKGQY